MIEAVNGLTGIAVIGVCYSLYKVANGRLKAIEEDKVERPECHIAQKGIHDRIDDMQKHICSKIDGVNTRIDDLKDLVKKK